MFFIKDQYATIWKVENKGNYSECRISTSRKDQENKYHDSNWSFVRFVGKAHNSLIKHEIKEMTRILIKSGSVTQEAYMKDGEKKYPKTPNIAVFEFEIAVKGGSRMDTAPVVEDERGPVEEDGMPF